jgi:hypothetical protein
MDKFSVTTDTLFTMNNIVEAVSLLNILHAEFSRQGFNFAIAGSVARNGVGKDIDIYVINYFGIPDIREQLTMFLTTHRFELCYKVFDGLAFIRTFPNGLKQYLDISIYNKTR